MLFKMKARFCRGLSRLLLLENTTYRFYTIYRAERDSRSRGKRSKLALIRPEMWDSLGFNHNPLMQQMGAQSQGQPSEQGF